MSQPTAQSFTVAQLCQQLGLPVPTQGGGLVLTGVQPLGLAGPTHLSFFDNQMYKEGARTTAAGAVLVRPADAEILPPTCAAILAPQPYMALAQALQLLYPTPELVGGISQFAVVSSSATVHPTARVEPYAVIYAEAHIEAGAHIGAHAVIGSGCVVGAGSRVGAHVTLHKTTLGERCLIHPGARLGQDGFGFAVHQDKILKIPQIGRVMVGNEVEIGANSTIDCGALGDTLIHDHAKIDNQVQIAHNVVIGRGSRIVAQVGIAGSAQLGEFTVIGGQSGISGHTTLPNRVMVAARSGVTKSISVVGQVVGGFPAVPMAEWRKSMAMLARLSKGLVPNKALPTAPAAPANPNTANPFA